MAYSKLKIDVIRIIAILLLLSLSLGIYNKAEAGKEEVVEKLLVSVYDKNGKTHMWKVIPKKKKEELILKNREVMTFGDISTNEEWLAYDDAIGTGPWELFVKNLKNRKVFQVTNNDQAGEIDIEILSEKPLKICVSRGGLSSPIPRIWIFDVEMKKAQMVKPINSDMVFDSIEVIDSNHILTITYSSKDEKKMYEDNSSVDSIKHTFYIIDLKNQKYTKITELKAGSIGALSFVPKSNIITFSATNIYLNSTRKKGETGIYKLDLKSKVIVPILTESMLKKIKDTPVEEFASPIEGYLSNDGKKLWFIGIPKDAKRMMFGEGIEAYPSAVFEYDLKEKKVRKIFEKKNTFITSMTVSYGK
ncbi:hypothetical protein Calkro_1747 [Caldicellulosiruptor kronotskyensis 2002]|uniref:WD40-like beta Propeller containing protein n=1 Tax=Caldicellulosiruptor kronotskyensis (strain DSM 18902 / VKM B-2412 / 2002) TaxID=632348 RepID=E4SFS3_CALK2|nr:hypothetical protein [Caldicellulosiruptor kronotskyensis]ADQ46598.1 hypothetical protein Calkro_1747 [Caldicellulosiruptor kronotskyensis 2002]